MMLRYLGSRFLRILKLFMDNILVPKGYVVTRIDCGQFYIFNPSDSAQGYILYTAGTYGAGTELVAQMLFSELAKESRWVVDVGAHYGFYTLLAAVRVSSSGKVLAFEPSKENFRVLKLNIALNKLRNVEPLNVGLWDRETKAYIGIPRGGASGENTLAIDVKRSDRVETAKLLRFDTLAREMNVDVIDLVKIDVEGAEFHVIKGFGSYLEKCKYILLEVHPQHMAKLGSSPMAMYNYLKKMGFQVYLLGEWKIVQPLVIEHYKKKITVRHHALVTRLDIDRVINLARKLKREGYKLTPMMFFDRRHRLAIHINTIINTVKSVLRECHGR